MTSTTETYRCFGLKNRKRHVADIPASDVTGGREYINKFKVFTPKAKGPGASQNILGESILARPGDVCTQTFLVLNPCDTQDEAANFLRYMSTRTFRFLVKCRKVSQDLGRGTYKWVPNLPMDQVWTDELLYEKFGFTAEQIAHIESEVSDPAEWLNHIKDPGTREALGLPALTDSDN